VRTFRAPVYGVVVWIFKSKFRPQFVQKQEFEQPGWFRNFIILKCRYRESVCWHLTEFYSLSSLSILLAFFAALCQRGKLLGPIFYALILYCLLMNTYFILNLCSLKFVQITLKCLVHISQRTTCLSITNISQLMMLTKIIVLYSEVRNKYINTLSGQNAIGFNIKAPGTYSNQLIIFKKNVPFNGKENYSLKCPSTNLNVLRI
jgi:hypothetical protein